MRFSLSRIIRDLESTKFYVRIQFFLFEAINPIRIFFGSNSFFVSSATVVLGFQPRQRVAWSG
ncbi:hypothetical protein CsSME_00047851 [Camellia sinensis var. sinensis]